MIWQEEVMTWPVVGDLSQIGLTRDEGGGEAFASWRAGRESVWSVDPSVCRALVAITGR